MLSTAFSHLLYEDWLLPGIPHAHAIGDILPSDVIFISPPLRIAKSAHPEPGTCAFLYSHNCSIRTGSNIPFNSSIAPRVTMIDSVLPYAFPLSTVAVWASCEVKFFTSNLAVRMLMTGDNKRSRLSPPS